MTSPTPPAESPEQRLRIILVDDSSLFREGLAALLAAAGLQVVAQLGDAVRLPEAIRRHTPQVILLDARMPPTHTDEGITAALQVRQHFPGMGVLVLSTYAEGTWANQLFSTGSTGLGYLLKDRVNDTSALIDAIRRVSAGGTAVDPEVIQRLLAITNHRSTLERLSEREHDVLSLMAQGRSNVGIGQFLHLSPRTVEAYIASVFVKLPLDTEDNTVNRRVLAVLAYLQDRDRFSRR